MKAHAVVVHVAVASAFLFAGTSWAHGPGETERHIAAPPASKPVPTTCEQLADPGKFSNDPTHPDIKALQARCEAEKKAAAGKTL